MKYIVLLILVVVLSACGSTPTASTNSDIPANAIFLTDENGNKLPAYVTIDSVGGVSGNLLTDQEGLDTGWGEYTADLTFTLHNVDSPIDIFADFDLVYVDDMVNNYPVEVYKNYQSIVGQFYYTADMDSQQYPYKNLGNGQHTLKMMFITNSSVFYNTSNDEERAELKRKDAEARIETRDRWESEKDTINLLDYMKFSINEE